MSMDAAEQAASHIAVSNSGGLEGLSDEVLEDLYEAIQDGATNLGEAFGFDESALNTIESMALSQYQAVRYDAAAKIYFFILRMNVRRGSAWRGLGACAHATKLYGMAARCYQVAAECSPTDLISVFLRGECLCALGEADEGLKILGQAAEAAGDAPDLKPYVVRAQAIIAAEGGTPPRVVLLREGQDPMANCAQTFRELGVEFNPDQEINLDDMMKNPVLREQMGEVHQALTEGRLTLADVGGFTEPMLEGAFGLACQYFDAQAYPMAIQTCGYLMIVDPYNGRYYQFVGLCLQTMQQYEQAEHFYRMATLLSKEDGISWVYWGECKIMAGQTDAGLDHVRKGLELCRGDSELAEICQRAETLIGQFG